MPRTATGQFRAETPWETSKRQRREARQAQRDVVEARRLHNVMRMQDVAAALHGRTA